MKGFIAKVGVLMIASSMVYASPSLNVSSAGCMSCHQMSKVKVTKKKPTHLRNSNSMSDISQRSMVD